MSCYKLTRLKRFVSQITVKLCNYLFYLATFNTSSSCMHSKIRCDEKSGKILEFWVHLNKACSTSSPEKRKPLKLVSYWYGGQWQQIIYETGCSQSTLIWETETVQVGELLVRRTLATNYETGCSSIHFLIWSDLSPLPLISSKGSW